VTAVDRLAALAHELRSPVAALAAIREAYVEGDDERRRRLLELAGVAVASIERLIADATLPSLRLERLDVGGLTVDVVEAAALGRAGIVAEVERGLVVDGDGDRLRQALANLIANAVGHSPPGATVRVSARGRGALVVLAVADEGDGIAAVDIARVFEPGVRLTQDRPGSGLGLALVRTIAIEHGGDVEVESSPGRGATFRLVLPAASGGG
jgi:signal transduction histidine kinase